MKTDVLLLADVFETFRDSLMHHCGLDPAHYFSSPGMPWDAALKMSIIALELFIDINMYLFIKKGLRGGISMVSKRYAKGNNPQCPDSKPTTSIMYLDANNLHGLAMSQP